MYKIEGQKFKGKFNTYNIVKSGAFYVAKIGNVEKFKSADLSKLLRAIKKREDQTDRYLKY